MSSLYMIKDEDGVVHWEVYTDLSVASAEARDMVKMFLTTHYVCKLVEIHVYSPPFRAEDEDGA